MHRERIAVLSSNFAQCWKKDRVRLARETDR